MTPAEAELFARGVGTVLATVLSVVCVAALVFYTIAGAIALGSWFRYDRAAVPAAPGESE